MSVQICKVKHDASTVAMTITMAGDDNEDDGDDIDDDGFGDILIYKAQKRIDICT